MNSRHSSFKQFLVAFLVTVLIEGAVTAQNELAQQRQLLIQGRQLSMEEVSALQVKADAAPDDIDLRLQLVGYYFGAIFRSPDARQAHEQLTLWFIEKVPHLPICGNPEIQIHSSMNPEGFEKAKSLWMKNIEEFHSNTLVLANAATFFLLSDRSMAEKLLLKCQQLEPDNPKWPEQLGQLYKLDFHFATGAKRLEIAAKSLEQFERALNLHRDATAIFAILPAVAVVAFEAGADEKAKQYAIRLLESSNDPKTNWNAGNAIHHGNLILGRLALKAGNAEVSIAHLKEAGKTSGSPQLNSFGPNMTLAKELLEKGEQTAVLEYFDLCRKFWHHDDTLNQWAVAVRAGGIPEFGGNLLY